MATGVGLSAPESCAAIRTRIAAFKETRFISAGGDWIIGSEVPLDRPVSGVTRLAHLLLGPLRECLDVIPGVSPDSIPLILCLAEEQRPGRFKGLGGPILLEVGGLLGLTFHSRSLVIEQGRVGGAVALHYARRMINEEKFRYVIVAGVDSYFSDATLAVYQEQERILADDNTDGFIPGEAGSACLVTDRGGTLSILGMGFGREEATVLSGAPLRAEGLRKAIFAALAEAGLAMHDIDFRIVDVAGEQYAFKEASLALSRTLRRRKEVFDIWQPADCIGEVGAAVLPCMLGVAFAAAKKSYAPGRNILCHVANDDGRRVAAVVRIEGGGA